MRRIYTFLPEHELKEYIVPKRRNGCCRNSLRIYPSIFEREKNQNFTTWRQDATPLREADSGNKLDKEMVVPKPKAE